MTVSVSRMDRAAGFWIGELARRDLEPTRAGGIIHAGCPLCECEAGAGTVAFPLRVDLAAGRCWCERCGCGGTAFDWLRAIGCMIWTEARARLIDAGLAERQHDPDTRSVRDVLRDVLLALLDEAETDAAWIGAGAIAARMVDSLGAGHPAATATGIGIGLRRLNVALHPRDRFRRDRRWIVRTADGVGAAQTGCLAPADRRAIT